MRFKALMYLLAFCCLTLGCQKSNSVAVDSARKEAGSADAQNGPHEKPLPPDTVDPVKETLSTASQAPTNGDTEPLVTKLDTMRLRGKIASLDADTEEIRQQKQKASRQLKFVSQYVDSLLRHNRVSDDFFLQQEYNDRKAAAIAGLRPSLEKLGNAIKIGDQKLRQQALIDWIENTEPCFAYGIGVTNGIEKYEKAATFDLFVGIVKGFSDFENAVVRAERDSLFTRDLLDRVKQDSAALHDELNMTIQTLQNQTINQEKQIQELLELISTKPYAEIEHQVVREQVLAAGSASDAVIVLDDRFFRFEMTLDGRSYSVGIEQALYPTSRQRSSIAAEQFGWSYMPYLPSTQLQRLSGNQVSLQSEYWRGTISQVGDSPDSLQAWMERAESVVEAFGKVVSGQFFDGLVRANGSR